MGGNLTETLPHANTKGRGAYSAKWYLQNNLHLVSTRIAGTWPHSKAAASLPAEIAAAAAN